MLFLASRGYSPYASYVFLGIILLLGIVAGIVLIVGARNKMSKK